MIQPDTVFDPSVANHIEAKITAFDIMFLNIALRRGDYVFLFSRSNPGFGRAEFFGPGRLDLDKNNCIAGFANYIDLLAIETITLFQNLIALIGEIFDRKFLGLDAKLARPRFSQVPTAPEVPWPC
jgi:hypothetical protein